MRAQHGIFKALTHLLLLGFRRTSVSGQAVGHAGQYQGSEHQENKRSCSRAKGHTHRVARFT